MKQPKADKDLEKAREEEFQKQAEVKAARAALKKKRTQEKEQSKELNNTGKRLGWIRERVGITRMQLAAECEIPYASYQEHEINVRTTYYEEYLVLASVLNKYWQAKYKKDFPHYQGVKVTKITPMFLLFGQYESNENYQSIWDKFCKLHEDQLRQIERYHEHMKEVFFREKNDIWE
jgi:hypothetical protein